jgi:hypothetical protein
MQHTRKQRSDSGKAFSSAGWPIQATSTNELKHCSHWGSVQTIIRLFCRTNVFLMLAAIAFALPAQGQTTVTFDIPGSVNMFGGGISQDGAITGAYFDLSVHKRFGFVRTPDGRITTFIAPADHSSGATGVGINSAGVITGGYGIFAGNVSGIGDLFFDGSFLRLPDGTIFDISPPTAYFSDPAGINDQGTVAGTYMDAQDGSAHFFLRTADGTCIEFDPELGAQAYLLGGINPSGAVTGCYFDSNGNVRSFVRTAQGKVTLFDAPNAVYGTQAASINPSGAITGYYYDAEFNYHGFLRGKAGQITEFDPQGSAGTNPVGITPNGTIAGYYYDANFNTHGFVRAKNGKITTFDPQGSIGTIVTGMNARGMITGTYRDAHGVHGFVFHSGAD